MDTGEWITIAVGFVTILIAIFGMGLVLIQKIDSGDARLDNKIDGVKADLDDKIDAGNAGLDNKIDGVKAGLDNKIDAGNASITVEIRSFRESVENRINGVEREQARQEGVLSVLVQRDSARRDGGDKSDESESSE